MTDGPEVLSIVRAHLGAVLRIDPETISPDAPIISLPNAESLRLTEAITRVEDQLDIALLSRDDLLEVRSVADLANLAATLVEYPTGSMLK